MMINKKNMEQGKRTRDKIYKYLVEYIEEHSYAPSVREIADAVGITSTSTVFFQLRNLEEMHKIARDYKKPRAIKIVEMESVKNAHSDKMRKELCEGCLNHMKESLTEEQLMLFRKIFMNISEQYMFNKK